MRRLWLAAVVMVALVSCAGKTAEQPAATTPTTTGMIPAGAPTEGTRPRAEGLPPPAEPQKAPPQTAAVPGRTVVVGAAPEGVVVDAVT